MKKRFRFEDYKGRCVMHCKTEDEAIAFCKFMHEDGRKWHTDKSYLEDNFYKMNTKYTCYNFNDGRFDDISLYRKLHYTILKYSDFDWSKQFTKSDLVPVFKATNFKLAIKGVDIDITDEQAKRIMNYIIKIAKQ